MTVYILQQVILVLIIQLTLHLSDIKTDEVQLDKLRIHKLPTNIRGVQSCIFIASSWYYFLLLATEQAKSPRDTYLIYSKFNSYICTETTRGEIR